MVQSSDYSDNRRTETPLDDLGLAYERVNLKETILGSGQNFEKSFPSIPTLTRVLVLNRESGNVRVTGGAVVLVGGCSFAWVGVGREYTKSVPVPT